MKRYAERVRAYLTESLLWASIAIPVYILETVSFRVYQASASSELELVQLIGWLMSWLFAVTGFAIPVVAVSWRKSGATSSASA